MFVCSFKSFKDKRLESCVRVKHKALEDGIAIANVSILKLHIIQCLLSMTDSENIYIVSAQIRSVS